VQEAPKLHFEEKSHEPSCCSDHRRPYRHRTRHRLAFAHEGAQIVVSGRRDKEGNALASELRTLGVEAQIGAYTHF